MAATSRHSIFDVHYARRADGAKTAYGIVGSGRLLLYPPGLMSTLEWASDSPCGPDFFGALAAHRTVVAYDRHGCGLSDRNRRDFSLADDIQDIQAVVGAIGPEQFDIVTASWGPVLAVTFAALHPDLVRRMVFLDGTIREETVSSPRYAAMMALLRSDREAFVQVLTGLGFPNGADEETLASVTGFLRTAASDEVLLGLCQAIPQVRHHLSAIQAPTLLVHRQGDRIVTVESGKSLADGIVGARFLLVEGDEHVPWTGDWQSLVTPAIEFLLEDGPEVRNNYGSSGVDPRVEVLTPREVEVLRLIAHGRSNPEVASALSISLNTVQRHVSSILRKAELRNRTEAAGFAIRNHLA